ncbi:glycine--tRNA ligase subunit beta [bacterium]|nr:glycine--tRNA ligase subunit beta [bacterium]
MSKYLLEIGCEELPYKFIAQAISQLKAGFSKLLTENNINYSDIEVYATPRRLAVIVSGLSEKQDDAIKILRGPIKNVAYDENGNLTKAGEGFLKKNGLNPQDAYLEDNYLHAKIEVKGKETAKVLQENIPSLILKMQGSHFMRWDNFDEKFQRPIRWIVSIMDNNDVPLEIINVKSGRVSRGHRFANLNFGEIPHPDKYKEVLREMNVIVDQNERKAEIIRQSKAEADKIGAVVRYSDDLLEEVTQLCEWPVAVTCEFDEKFLTIPEEVTVTVMAVHQRYFALYKDGKLTNKFITITNYVGDEFENIKAGNLRVIKARLDDAVFFFNEDTKKPLSDYVEGLKGMTFQKGMGSIYEKTQRIVELSSIIAKELGKESETITRTAQLCKADLCTSLVFEFTELQGYIGSDYARISGEPQAVVDGIKEHYFPLNADSELAKSIEGQIVGIADKMDTICAVFTDGKKPTGSSDPLGVRRAALGIIKTIIANSLKLDINKLIEKSLELLPVKKDCIHDIQEFFTQRLIIFLNDEYKKDILEACLSKNPLADLSDYVARVKAVSMMKYPDLLESANRVTRILKEPVHAEINRELFKHASESMLFDYMNQITVNSEYKYYLNDLNALVPAINQFFDNVLVLDEDVEVKTNRLALLTILKEKFEQLCDFSKIQY